MIENREGNSRKGGHRASCEGGEGEQVQTEPHITPHPRTKWGAGNRDDEESQEDLKQAEKEPDRPCDGQDRHIGRANVDDVDTGAGVKEADKRL